MNSRVKFEDQSSVVRRVRNHAGRVDVLASKLITEAVKQQKNPILTMLHNQLMPTLVEPVIHYYLGPRNKHIRKVTRIVRQVTGVPPKPKVRRAES